VIVNSKLNDAQLAKFKAAAKEAGADMSDAEFKKVVGKLAKAPKPGSSKKVDKAGK